MNEKEIRQVTIENVIVMSVLDAAFNKYFPTIAEGPARAPLGWEYTTHLFGEQVVQRIRQT